MIEKTQFESFIYIGGTTTEDFWQSELDLPVCIETNKDALPSSEQIALASDVSPRCMNYQRMALEFLEKQATSNPEKFGAEPKEITSLLKQELVSDPVLIIRKDGNFDFHFRNGIFPICEPHGLIVSFEKGVPSAWEDLSKAEEQF
jgi:hypothetical protein